MLDATDWLCPWTRKFSLRSAHSPYLAILNSPVPLDCLTQLSPNFPCPCHQRWVFNPHPVLQRQSIWNNTYRHQHTLKKQQRLQTKFNYFFLLDCLTQLSPNSPCPCHQRWPFNPHPVLQRQGIWNNTYRHQHILKKQQRLQTKFNYFFFNLM